jgi:hypothetical protein
MSARRALWFSLGLVLLIGALGLGVFLGRISAEPRQVVVNAPTLTPPPTFTPQWTYTPAPFPTGQPTYTPQWTYTPAPTYTHIATFTALPTYTPLPTLTTIPTSTPVIISSGTIIDGVQPLGQLISYNLQLANVNINVGVQSGVGNVCGFSARHAAEGQVQAGIDLTSIGAEDITYDYATNTYTLVMPPVALTNCQVDFLDQYSYSTTACNADWDGARIIANYLAIESFRDQALESNIIGRAEQQARFILQNFLEDLTDANVVIVTGTSSTPLATPACYPPVPDGWQYDSISGAWRRTR